MWTRKVNLRSPAQSGCELAGAGVGLNAALAGFELNIAGRTQGGEPDSIPRADVGTSTVLVQVSKAF